MRLCWVELPHCVHGIRGHPSPPASPFPHPTPAAPGTALLPGASWVGTGPGDTPRGGGAGGGGLFGLVGNGFSCCSG